MIADSGFSDYTELFRFLYDEVENITSDKIPDVIADISKGAYQDVLVVDKEINFIATISTILGENYNEHEITETNTKTKSSSRFSRSRDYELSKVWIIRSFIQGYVIKKLSAIMSPTGEEVIAPVQVFNCGNCGEILPLNGEMDELI